LRGTISNMSDSEEETGEALSPVPDDGTKWNKDKKSLAAFRSQGAAAIQRGRGRGRAAVKSHHAAVAASSSANKGSFDLESPKAMKDVPTLEELAYGNGDDVERDGEDLSADVDGTGNVDAESANGDGSSAAAKAGSAKPAVKKSWKDESDSDDSGEPSDEETRERLKWRRMTAMPAADLLAAAQRGFTNQLIASLDVSADGEEASANGADAAAEDGADASASSEQHEGDAEGEDGEDKARSKRASSASAGSATDSRRRTGSGSAASGSGASAASAATGSAARGGAGVASSGSGTGGSSILSGDNFDPAVLADPDVAVQIMKLRAYEQKLKKKEGELSVKEATIAQVRIIISSRPAFACSAHSFDSLAHTYNASPRFIYRCRWMRARSSCTSCALTLTRSRRSWPSANGNWRTRRRMSKRQLQRP
jgi:hypothetical protein